MRCFECSTFLASYCTFCISTNIVCYDQLALSICCRRASSNMGGSSFPRRSALRKIPSQAFALKKYFSGTLASKICDKVDSTAALGDAPVLSVHCAPGKAPTISHDASFFGPLPFRRLRNNSLGVCDFCELSEDGFEVLSFVGAERSGDILPNSESWVFSTTFLPHFFDDPHGFHEQAASCCLFIAILCVFQSGALAGHTQILAR